MTRQSEPESKRCHFCDRLIVDACRDPLYKSVWECINCYRMVKRAYERTFEDCGVRIRQRMDKRRIKRRGRRSYMQVPIER